MLILLKENKDIESYESDFKWQDRSEKYYDDEVQRDTHITEQNLQRDR